MSDRTFQTPTVADIERITTEQLADVRARAESAVETALAEISRRGLARSGAAIDAAARVLDEIHIDALNNIANLIADFTQRHNVALEGAIEAARPQLEAFTNALAGRLSSISIHAGVPSGERVNAFKNRLLSTLKDLRIGYVGRRSVVAPKPDVSASALKLLEALYQDAQINISKPINFLDAGMRIGLPTAVAVSANNYLTESGLVHERDLAHRVTLTPTGVAELESARRQPDQPTQHFPAYYTINIQNAINSPVAMTAGGGHVSQTITYTTGDVAEIRGLLQSVETHLADLRLDARNESNARAMMATIRAQIEAEPDSQIVKRAGASLQTIVEGAMGNLSASGVQALWPSILAGLARLFG